MPPLTRALPCIHTRSLTTATATTSTLPPRWLSDLRARIGKCISFGITPAQTTEAAAILQETTTDWRALVAGSEGFLTADAYTGLKGQSVVWGEMDSMGHVNNVVYNRYAESARVNWTRNFARLDPGNRRGWEELMVPSGVGLILRSIRTEYKFPMKWPDKITVLHKLRHKPTAGSDHFLLDVVILSESQRRAAARCEEDIVVYDYRGARKTALPPFMIDMFARTWELQEEARRVNGERVVGLLGRVRELERGSWDREGAVEDMGGGD